MQKVLLTLLVVLIVPAYLFAQTDTTLVKSSEKQSFISKQILPLGLITTGALLNIGEIKYTIHDHIPHTGNSIDDYIQYAPIAQMYAYDALGFEHQNTVFDQTKYLLFSHLVSSATVHLLKNTIDLKRPNGSAHAFPSGHTTTAFVNATVLYHEFKDTEPLLAWSDYLFATATGALRMTNNAHWLPDVLAGAGIAILSTNLIYYFKPFQNFQPFPKKKDLSITPILTPGALAIQCRF